MKKLILTATLLIGTSAFAGGGSSVGPANPASVNCIKLGGTTESVTTPQGQDENCAISQWQIYNEMAARNLVKLHQYPGYVPNPAAVNCTDIGGTLRPTHTPAGDDADCVVNSWALFNVIH